MSYSSICISNSGMGFWDDEDEPCGRIITQEEYINRLRNRADIFNFDTNIFLKRIETLCLCSAIAVGIWLSTVELISISSDYYDRTFSAYIVDKGSVRILNKPLDMRKKTVPTVVDVPKKLRRSHVRRNAVENASGGKKGGGNPRSRIMKKGVLGLVNGQVTGNPVHGDFLGKGGYADKIDALLSGLGGLKRGSSGKAGRRGEGVIGFGPGFGGNFGKGSGDYGSEIDKLFAGEKSDLTVKPTEPRRVITSITEGHAPIVGGRSRRSIMRVIQQNIAALRYAYNRRLRERPGLKGKIQVRFAIDEFGRVIFCEVIGSTVSDAVFEKDVVTKIRRWVFEKIDKPGDVTEVTYPFVFSL